MALKIYESASPDTSFSQAGEMSNPLRLSFDGRTGSSKSNRYFLRNDNAGYEYSDITLQVVDTEGEDIVDGTNGYSWKLSYGWSEPTSAEWTLISGGNTITTSGISDISTYEPFWVKSTVPRGAPVKTHTGIVLRINATETIVP